MAKVDWSTALGKAGAFYGTGAAVAPDPISKAALTALAAGAGFAQKVRNDAKAKKAAEKAMNKKPSTGFPLAWIIAGAGIVLLLLFKRK